MRWLESGSYHQYHPLLLPVHVVIVALILNSALLCNGGITSSYVRSAVHITQGDYLGQGIIVSWITPVEPGSSTVFYWAENTTKIYTTEGYYLTYRFYNYTLGFIHHTTLLNYNTKYYYEVGVENTTRQFYFTTPPIGPDVPCAFGLIGDLGQTYNSNTTPTHYQNDPFIGQTVLYLGDLSYADNWPNHDNVKWDTYGRFIEVQLINHGYRYRIANIAYNITNELCIPTPNQFAPIYLTVGDGGNMEGLASASYGQGMFSIKNRTHTYFTWNRNQDGYAVKDDTFWFYNRYWYPKNETAINFL
ncbi:hypothetical protein NE237_026249 [Protea cynaroides]|uniref:Purple acid phosphatase N-terminal domain-containing protein n=1 Tax=Protea cynaroides TaxID=273540 RepID=A0A9Q0H6C7_9MAGN|nr:hypothetical protein NE237_026249 [Protea cynaroides]